jgi:hypothetical protein
MRYGRGQQKYIDSTIKFELFISQEPRTRYGVVTISTVQQISRTAHNLTSDE